MLFFSINLKIFAQDLKVYVFYSMDCPICNASFSTLVNLQNEFSGKVIWTYVFQNKISKSELKQIQGSNLNSNISVVIDKKQKLIKKYNATVTPEVVVVKSNTIYYRGKIDNLFEAIGQRRPASNINYLKDAIENILNGNEEHLIKETIPVGCIITRK